MLGALNQWAGMDRAKYLLGLRLALSAWIAFALASLLHIENAFWAAMPVWVVTQASRGLLLERAFFRIAGTLLGATLGFAILAAPGNPYLQLGMLGWLVAICAGLTHILRGVHSYAPLMTGITAAVVVLPSVSAPELSGPLAVARVECTLIGVITVTVIMGLFTPRTSKAAFYQRLLQVATDAVHHAAATIESPAPAPLEQARLLGALSELDSQARFVSAGSLNAYRRLRHVDRLLMATFVIMASAESVRASRLVRAIDERAVADGLRRFADHLGEPETRVPLAGSQVELPDTPPGRRLRKALTGLLRARAGLLDQQLKEGGAEDVPPIDPNRDWFQASQTGLTAAAAVAIGGSLAYATGSFAVQLGALGVTIFAMVLGSVPAPRRLAPQLLRGVLVGVALATFYRMAIQPVTNDLGSELLGLLPFMLLGGLAKASARFAVPAVDANMCFMLASQAGLPPAAYMDILAGSGALVAGAILTTGLFLWLSTDSSRQTRRLVRDLLDDHVRLTERSKIPPHEVWQAMTARKLLRLVQHVANKGRANAQLPEDLLHVLSLGDAIITLKRLASTGDRQAPANRALIIIRGYPRAPEVAAAALVSLRQETSGDIQLLASLEASASGVSACATLVDFTRRRV